MTPASRQSKGRDGVLSTLDVVIQGLDLAKNSCCIPPAQAAFCFVSTLLTMIRDSMANDQCYVDLGVFCADVCKALDRGLHGRRSDELGQPVLGAIEHLTTTVAEIQKRIIDQGKRHPVSRVLHTKTDRDMIAVWRQDLNRILQIFNTELLINNNMMLSALHRSVAISHEGTVDQPQSARAVPVVASTSGCQGLAHLHGAALGESSPPPLRTCFGRDGLIDEIVGLAERFKPVALIGVGGIGKTSIALSVLHHARIKERFGDNRRFISCDEFPASRAHFLRRLSKVIGAGIENPEDLTPLRPFLSLRKMILFLDNAESILDPAGPDAGAIYTLVEELTRFENICLGITSRIATVPPHCKRPAIPTLSMESACDIFYDIYDNGGRSDLISDLVRRLDFHPLSITLLATVAFHNMWDYGRLAKEWEAKRAQVLRIDHNQSLETTIELSLASHTFHKLTPSPSTFQKLIASPTFRKLIPSSMLPRFAPSPRELLEVVAFFPQGVSEDNLDWLFPTIPDRKNILDKFCVLSLAHRNKDGFVTMLAPIRDYLRPRDPKSSRLLCATKDRYFSRLSIDIEPDMPGFEEAKWIISEDVNVEHLLETFISIDPTARGIWEVCHHFMEHLHWYKPRQTVLRPKIEALSDDHPSKPKCLSGLSSLFGVVGNHAERKRLLNHTLGLEKRREDGPRIARTLRCLSDVNRNLGLHKEGIQQAKEALEILERLGDTIGQANCLSSLAWSLFSDKQLDAAADAAFRTINLAQEKGQTCLVCKSHCLLGSIYRSKREKEQSIHHFETALAIAPPFNWHDHALFWIHYSLALLFLDGEEFDDANAHIKLAKTHAAGKTYYLGRVMATQAQVWYQQGRLEDAASEISYALESCENVGASKDVGVCRKLLGEIECAMKSRPTSVDSNCSTHCAFSNALTNVGQGIDHRSG